MTDDPKDKFKQATIDLDSGLNGLFGALGDALSDMVSKLEEGKSGAVTRDHVIDTDKGPVRAHAGIRVQMGGLDGVKARSSAAGAKPINPGRTRPEPAQPPKPKTIAYDLFEDTDAWIFTADLPGIGQDDLKLRQDGTHLNLITSGQRLFEAQVDLGQPFDFEKIETRLHNGVLTLNIPKLEQS